MPMGYEPTIFYGKKITVDDAENRPIKELDKTLHKLKSYISGESPYIQGAKLAISNIKLYMLVQDDEHNFFHKFLNRSNVIREISEEVANMILDTDSPDNIFEKVEGYKYYIYSYLY